VITLVLVNALSGTTPPPPAQKADAGPVRDVATADPCGLLDQNLFTQYGEVTLETEYGNFDRCDVIIETSTRREVDVKVDLENQPSPDLPPAGTAEQHSGHVTSIVRQKLEGDTCERILQLSDKYRISVTADAEDGGADLCTIADTATQKAVSVLDAGPIPRRSEPFPATSLAQVDACSLLDSTALALIPGVDGTHPNIAFGNWECGWDSTTSDLSVQLIFDRDQPLTAADGQPAQVNGKATFLESAGDGPDTCVSRIVHRNYEDPNGQTAIEMVKLIVSGPGSTSSLCELTTKLTQAAAAKLPRT
jgi:hypothetical protein